MSATDFLSAAASGVIYASTIDVYFQKDIQALLEINKKKGKRFIIQALASYMGPWITRKAQEMFPKEWMLVDMEKYARELRFFYVAVISTIATYFLRDGDVKLKQLVVAFLLSGASEWASEKVIEGWFGVAGSVKLPSLSGVAGRPASERRPPAVVVSHM